MQSTVHCPICGGETPGARVGPYTFVECAACGPFAYDRPSAATLRAGGKLREIALSHIETALRIWPGQVACFKWLEGEMRFAWLPTPSAGSSPEGAA